MQNNRKPWFIKPIRVTRRFAHHPFFFLDGCIWPQVLSQFASNTLCPKYNPQKTFLRSSTRPWSTIQPPFLFTRDKFNRFQTLLPLGKKGQSLWLFKIWMTMEGCSCSKKRGVTDSRSPDLHVRDPILKGVNMDEGFARGDFLFGCSRFCTRCGARRDETVYIQDANPDTKRRWHDLRYLIFDKWSVKTSSTYALLVTTFNPWCSANEMNWVQR